jgi:nucleoside-diphosphate-sugar epimerase
MAASFNYMKPKIRILLTGASGAVGHEVLNQLILQKEIFEITVFDFKSTHSQKILSSYKNDARFVFGDIAKFDDVRKVASSVDVVIHLAAIIPPLADEHPEQAFQVNTQGTENLVRNIEQHSPDAFFLYSSSISVYGDRIENPLIKVGDNLTPSEGDYYAITKIKAEQIIKDSKLKWSIFRLTAIMGQHKLSKLMFHMPLDTPLEICTREDAGRAYVMAIENKDILTGKIFNLGGGNNCRTTYKDFLVRSFEIMGLGKCDFPGKAFADKNFHCGLYQDGDDLDAILHFRKDSLNDYFGEVKKSVPRWRKVITSVFKKQIKSYLLKKSDPYQAFVKGNIKMMEHYFRSNE